MSVRIHHWEAVRSSPPAQPCAIPERGPRNKSRNSSIPADCLPRVPILFTESSRLHTRLIPAPTSAGSGESGVRSAFFSGDMTAVVTAMVAFEESVLKAAAAAAADGKTPQAQRREGMLESDMTAIKRQVPGSLLEKKDGSWAVVAIRRGVIDKSPLVISVIEDDGSARERGRLSG